MVCANCATAHNPPSVKNLRRYNVNRGLSGLGNGEYLREREEYREMAARIEAETAAMTPEQIAAKAEMDAAIQERRYWEWEWSRGVEPGRNLGAQLLSPRGKILRRIIVNRDWPALFKLFPLYHPDGPDQPARGKGVWNPIWAISKYSFTGDGANKVYKPWSRADIRSWVFSPWYTVQPGYNCTDAQRETGINAYMAAQNRHMQKFGPSTYHYVWPIYPGSGYGWQDYGCRADKDSWWVKNRDVVVGAVAVATAVFLGPQIISAVTGGGTTATGTAAAAGTGTTAGTVATTGIVGAGTKAGAVAAVTTKATTAAAITVKSVSTATALAGVVESGTLFAKTQSAVELINKARTVDALIQGEMPPPPIGISGGNFTEWALDLAKDELRNKLQEEAGEYLTKKMQEKIIAQEEARLRAEIEAMQRELAGLVPAGTPVVPTEMLDPDVRAKLMEMQRIEQQREKENLTLLALGAGALLIMSG